MNKSVLFVSLVATFILVHVAGADSTQKFKDKQIEELSKKAFCYASREGKPTLKLITGYTGEMSDQEWYKEGFGGQCEGNVAALSGPGMALSIPGSSKILAFLNYPARTTQPESIVAIFDRSNTNAPLCVSRLNLLEETSDVQYYYWGVPDSIEARRASNGDLYVVVTLSGAADGAYWNSFAFLHIDMSCKVTVLSKLASGYGCNGGCEGTKMAYRFIGNDTIEVTETSFTSSKKAPEKTGKTTTKNYHLADLLNHPESREFPSEPERAAAMLHSGDVSIKETDGTTPLMWAVRDGFPELVRGLLKKGAKVNAKDKDGWTPLIWATRRCCPEPVKWVTPQGEEVPADEIPSLGTDKESCMAILKLLLDRGADANAKDQYGQTPLMLLAEQGSPEMIRALLDRGADVNARTRDGYTALMWAAYGGDSKVMEMLLNKGAEVNARDKLGWTALMSAAKGGNTNVIRLLLARGADINAKKKNGWTALMSAAKADHLQAVRLLLIKGADINARTTDGKTALKVARGKGNKLCVRLLKAHGAKE